MKIKSTTHNTGISPAANICTLAVGECLATQVAPHGFAANANPFTNAKRVHITPKVCISSTRSVVYHQHEVLYIINPEGIVYHQPVRAVYHQGEALYIITPLGVYSSLSVTALAVPPLPVGEAFCCPPF